MKKSIHKNFLLKKIITLFSSRIHLRRAIFSYLSLAIILSSCEDKIDVNLPKGETLLVVDGWITNEAPPYTVNLSTTAPYFDSRPSPKVQGALLVIRDNTGLTDTLLEVQPGKYQTTKIQGQIGRTYQLEIKNALGQEYLASSTMPRGSVIDSVKFQYLDKNGDKDDGYYMKYYGPEPEGKGDCYRFLVYINGELQNNPSDMWRVTNDDFVDGNYISEFDPLGKPLKSGDRLKVQGNAISRDAYYFFVELATQINNSGMFASPLANVRTNIQNKNSQSGIKAVGYFGASAVASYEVEVK
jgi:hypothetical protein